MQLLCFSCIHAILFVILIRNPSLSTFFNESPFFTLHSSSYCESISNTHFSSFKSETHSLLLEGWDEKKKHNKRSTFHDYFRFLTRFFCMTKIQIYDYTEKWLSTSPLFIKNTSNETNQYLLFLFLLVIPSSSNQIASTVTSVDSDQ